MEARKINYPKNKKRETKTLQSIYSRSLLTRNIVVPLVAVGKNIVETFEKHISKHFEGKCIAEGFVKNGSSKIITYSSGLIQKGSFVSFQVVFECEICFPVEGMLIQCVAKNITKAGIRAESSTDNPSPIVVFVARDHNFNHPMFINIQEEDVFTVRVIGQRFELNDKYVSIIGELIVPTTRQIDNPRTKLKESVASGSMNEKISVTKKRAKKITGKIVLAPFENVPPPTIIEANDPEEQEQEQEQEE